MVLESTVSEFESYEERLNIERIVHIVKCGPNLVAHKGVC